MQKRHVHTTLSLKHAQLLDKFGEKFGNKQKALELALENFENISHQAPTLSSEQQLLLRFFADKSIRSVGGGGFLWLLSTADFELGEKLVEREKPMEYTLEFIYQKPLKDCSLIEILNGLVLVSKMSNWYDTINYSQEGDHYLLRVYHSLGINGSKMSKMFGDSLFTTYGVKFESTISEKTVFFKIHKNR